MARLIKGGQVDDGQYPLPPDSTGSRGTPAAQQQQDEAMSGVDAAELRHAASELQQIVGMIHGLRPNVAQLADTLREGAREQGYSEGRAQAQTEVQGQLIEAIAALTAAQTERHRLAEQHQDALADLALKIARKVINAHLEADPTLVSRIVHETIAELEPTVSMKVQVHPEDLATVEAARADFERLVQGNGTIEILADDRVDRGGVMLLSPVGNVDARIETKLSVLQTAFTAQRRQMVDES